MMNNTLKFLVCLCLLCWASIEPAGAKKLKVKQKPLYMVGIAISPTDSVVYLTDLHLVKDLTVAKKKGYLMDRQLYSQQLRRYLETTYKGKTYVPAVFFSPKQKKMERRYLSLYKRYVNSKEKHIVLIDQSQFRFKAEEYIEQTIYEGEAPQKKQAKKQSKKQSKKKK